MYKNEEIGDDKKKNEPKGLSKVEVANPAHVLHEINEHTISIARKKQMMYQWATKFLASFLGQSNRD